ncbi:MAG: hypothetical protein IT428_26250 [Planctomycetaceae bacterium]|nr:hypothetical protein [Planctomycetaceae bacterium]
MSGFNSNAPRGFQTKAATVSNAAKAVSHADFAFTADELAQAVSAVITSRTAGVMVTWSGVDPTASLGHLVATNGTLRVDGTLNIQALKFIREAAADATVTVTLEK